MKNDIDVINKRFQGIQVNTVHGQNVGRCDDIVRGEELCV